MSGPTQNVYFYNPTSVNYVQSSIPPAKNQLGYGQTLTSTGAAAVVQQLQPFAYGNQAGPDFGQGVNDANHASGFIHYGNVKSGQEYFYATGYANGLGNQWTLNNTLVNPWSVGKSLIGLACTKMMEEGLIDADTTLFSIDYDEHIFTGSAQYFTDIEVTNPATFPFPGSYTPTTDTFDLTTLTIGDCINMNIGALQEVFSVPQTTISTTPQYGDGSSSLLGNLGSLATTADKAILIQSLTIFGLEAAGTPIGYSGKPFVGLTASPGDVKQMIINYFNAFRNGTLPLAYKPGDKIVPNFPYALRSADATYSFGYQVLAYVLGIVARDNGYTNLSTYIRQKFLTPLGMTNTYFYNQEQVNLTGNVMASEPWRRNIPLGACYYNSQTFAPQAFDINDPTTWPRLGCSTGYSTTCFTGTNIFIGSNGVLNTLAGPLAWPTNAAYANDGLSKMLNQYYYYTGPVSPTNAVDGAAPIITCIGDLGKLVKFLCNKGVTPSGQRLLTPDSYRYLISSKITSITGLPSNTDLENSTNDIPNNESFAMGLGRLNRDIQNLTTYGYSENTLRYTGIDGIAYLLDIYSGNWLIIGNTECGFSTGQFTIPASLMSDINAGIKSFNPGFPYTVKSSQLGSDTATTNDFGTFMIKMCKQ